MRACVRALVRTPVCPRGVWERSGSKREGEGGGGRRRGLAREEKKRGVNRKGKRSGGRGNKTSERRRVAFNQGPREAEEGEEEEAQVYTPRCGYMGPVSFCLGGWLEIGAKLVRRTRRRRRRRLPWAA